MLGAIEVVVKRNLHGCARGALVIASAQVLAVGLLERCAGRLEVVDVSCGAPKAFPGGRATGIGGERLLVGLACLTPGTVDAQLVGTAEERCGAEGELVRGHVDILAGRAILDVWPRWRSTAAIQRKSRQRNLAARE